MKQLIKGSAALIGVSIGEMFMRLVRTKCIALLLGPVGTGFLGQLFVFFELLRVWGDLGSRRGVIKQVAQYRKSGNQDGSYGEVVRSSYFLAIVASSIIGFLVTVFSPDISTMLYGIPDHYQYILFLGLLLPIASASTVTASIIKGNLAYNSFAKYTAFSYLGVIILTPFIVYFMRYWGAVLVQALFFIFPLIAYIYFNSKTKVLTFSKKVNFRLLKEQSSYGLVQIYQDSMMQIVRVMIGVWIVKSLGLAAMGLYQVIVTLSLLFMALPMQALSGYTLPVIAGASTPKEISRGINDTLRFLLFLLAPIIVLLIIWPESFICIFFSSDFLSAVVPLQIQLVATLFLLMAYPFTIAFQARGHLKPMIITSTLSALFYLSFSWLFFDLGGITGIAFAYGITNVLILIVQYSFCQQYYELYLVPKNLRLILATAVWVILALIAGMVIKMVAFRLLVTLSGFVWFYVSTKKHERDVLLAEWNSLKSKRFFAKAVPER